MKFCTAQTRFKIPDRPSSGEQADSNDGHKKAGGKIYAILAREKYRCLYTRTCSISTQTRVSRGYSIRILSVFPFQISGSLKDIQRVTGPGRFFIGFFLNMVVFPLLPVVSYRPLLLA
ncbi:MAG: hypothetical protein WCX22_09595 [Methanoregula sp.]